MRWRTDHPNPNFLFCSFDFSQCYFMKPPWWFRFLRYVFLFFLFSVFVFVFISVLETKGVSVFGVNRIPKGNSPFLGLNWWRSFLFLPCYYNYRFLNLKKKIYIGSFNTWWRCLFLLRFRDLSWEGWILLLIFLWFICFWNCSFLVRRNV